MGIRSLLNPRSIAIVGASDKIGPGFNAWKALEHVGYKGQIYLVNPGKTELLGQRVYPSLDAIDADVDAAFVAVRAEGVMEVARQAVARKVGGLAILSSGFGDAGPQGMAIQRELADYAEAHDIAICGPNCLGMLNFSAGAALFGTSLPDHVPRGGIAAVVQSGSVGIALLNTGRGLGLSHLITAGNEAVTTTADYLEALIDDEAVTTIVVFAEQIRKPGKFMAMARRASERGKPLIVLKSGRSESGRAAVMAHTGAVAGSVEACDAALAANGAIQVHTLDELLETAELVSRISRRPGRGRLAALSLSGGEIALALDAAEDSGAQFAPVGAAHDALAALLPAFAHIANPLDLTWAGLYDMSVASGCARALASQDDVAALLLLQDAPSGLGPQQAGRYAALLEAVAAGAEDAGKPLVALSNLSDPAHPALAEVARSKHVPYLRGTREGLLAVTRYVRWAQGARPPAEPTDAALRAQAAQRLAPFLGIGVPAEHEARDILAGYGVRGPDERFVADADAAVEAANALGYPIVLKGIVPGMLHKSDAGMVRLRLADAPSVHAAAQDMLARARADGWPVAGLLVQRMAPGIAELLVGARVDPDFGPIVVVGAGGVNVELYRDVAVRLAPLDQAQALEALQSTQVARTLAGWRGAPAGDIQAVARVISAVSHFIADFADVVTEVEINPLAVFPEGQGCLALDCVIVPSAAGTT